MKHMIFGAGLLLCLLPLSMTLIFREEKCRRQQELESALAQALRQSMETAYMIPCYDIRTEEELAADAVRHVILRMPAGDMTVRLWAVDLERGLIDLEIRIRYTFPLTKGYEVKSRFCFIREELNRKAEDSC